MHWLLKLYFYALLLCLYTYIVSLWNFTQRLSMMWRCSLLILRSRDKRSRSQCIDCQNVFTLYCFAFTPTIMKLNTKTSIKVWMCPIDFGVQRSRQGHNSLILTEIDLWHIIALPLHLSWNFTQRLSMSRRCDLLISGSKVKVTMYRLHSSERISAPALSGVPQGTVLGPLLYLLYINDLPEKTTSDARLFADDCLLYRPVTVKADTDTLQRDLDALIRWEEDWQMAFHPEKCVVIQVTNKRNPITANYTIHGHRLDVVDSSKCLGVTISKDLRWDNHINNVSAKANKTLGFIRRNMRGCRRLQDRQHTKDLSDQHLNMHV